MNQAMDDPFSLFGLPRSFALDLPGLRKQYLMLSARLHPDRHTDPLDQADAAELLSRINQAYRTLCDPHARAEVLLQLLGGVAGENDKSLPPELLEEMLEIREAMELASAQGDEQTLRQLHARGVSERDTRLQRISSLFAELEKLASPSHAAVLKQIRLELNALRYFERLIEQTPA